MLGKVYDLFETTLGESKQGGYITDIPQYQFNCPWCAEENDGEPDGKHNLEINFEMGKFHCWKCEAKGKLSYILKKWAGSGYLDEYFSLLNEIKESRLYDLALFSDTENGSIFDDENFLTLPKTFKKLDLSRYKSGKLIDFLKKRAITPEMVYKYNMGFTTFDEPDFRMRNRLIIPSYDIFGNLNYWVGRDYSGYEKAISYRNADADKKNIIFQESFINWDSDIYLCEGVLDCIRYENTISLLGKALTKDSEIYKKLYEKSNANIIVCLDGDTKIEETKRIYSLLNRGRLRGRVKYIRLGTDEIPFKDFSEIYENDGNLGMINAFKHAKEFSEIELLF